MGFSMSNITEKAFEKPCNLTGTGASTWEKLAQEAEAKGAYALAIKYYSNVGSTALGLGRKKRADDAIKRLNVLKQKESIKYV